MSIRRVTVKNRERAIAFYSAWPGVQAQQAKVLSFEEHHASPGMLLCFDVAQHFEEALAFVWSNGGRILDAESATAGSERRAYVLDCEGNKVALYASAAGTVLPCERAASRFARSEDQLDPDRG